VFVLAAPNVRAHRYTLVHACAYSMRGLEVRKTRAAQHMCDRCSSVFPRTRATVLGWGTFVMKSSLLLPEKSGRFSGWRKDYLGHLPTIFQRIQLQQRSCTGL
jgi:hypothetical protein